MFGEIDQHTSREPTQPRKKVHAAVKFPEAFNTVHCEHCCEESYSF